MQEDFDEIRANVVARVSDPTLPFTTIMKIAAILTKKGPGRYRDELRKALALDYLLKKGEFPTPKRGRSKKGEKSNRIATDCAQYIDEQEREIYKNLPISRKMGSRAADSTRTFVSHLFAKPEFRKKFDDELESRQSNKPITNHAAIIAFQQFY